jgi:hypothetical protein
MHEILAKLSKKLIETPNSQNEIKVPTQLPFRQLLIKQETNLGILDDIKSRKK